MTTQPTEKKKSDLAVRTVTGLLFGAVMAGGIVAHLYTFTALMAVVMVLSLREFYNITAHQRTDSKVRGWYLPLVILAALTVYATSFADSYYPKLTSGIRFTLLLPALFFLFFSLELFSQSKDAFRNIGHHVTAFAYLVLPFTLLMYLTNSGGEYTWRPVLAIILLIWANDSCAYLVGRQIGKTKLIPRISPGKTIEGNAGGAVGCAAAAIGLYYLIPVPGWEIYDWVVIAILTSIFATVGDLVESMLKRNLGIKDTSNLLPGHGGILDRFDAFYFTVPFVVAYLVARGLV